MVDDWTLVLIDVVGARPIADITAEAQDIKLTFRMRDQHEATWSVDGRSELARLTRELITDVMIVWRGQRLARLRVNQSSDDLGPDGHTTSFSAIDYRGMMARRFTRGAQVLNGDLAQMVWGLINWTQTTDAGGNWGITKGNTPAIASISNYQVAASRQFKELFEELSTETYPGFDWEIDAELRYQVWTFRGSMRPFALEWGGNVIAVQRDVDTTAYANFVRQSGAEGVAGATRSAPNLASRPEGRIEAAEGNPDLENPTLVGWAADAYLQRHGTLLPGYQMTVDPRAWDPGQLWLGDSSKIIVRSGRLDVSSIDRVFEIAVAIDANGLDTVDLTFGKLREDLLQLSRSMPGRIDRLYRN